MAAKPFAVGVGQAVGRDGPGSGSGAGLRGGVITVILRPDRTHNTEAFKRLIRPALRAVPDVRFTTQGGYGSADIEIVLAGQDQTALARTQLTLMRQMRTLKSITDVRPAPPPAGPELIVRPKPGEAARLGVTSDALATVLRIATIGDIDASVAKFSEGQRRIPIRVRLPEAGRADLATLGELRVPLADRRAGTPGNMDRPVTAAARSRRCASVNSPCCSAVTTTSSPSTRTARNASSTAAP